MPDVNEIQAALILAGAQRLLKGVAEPYGLDPAAVAERISDGITKYVLAYDPDPSDSEIAEYIEGLHGDDLCLVLSCEHGNDDAWNDMLARFNVTVRSAARSAAGSVEGAEDLAQSIWAELHGLKSTAGRPAGKLGYYSGRGSLGGWLRAVVNQLAVDQHRRSSRLVQAEDDGELERWSRSNEDEFAESGMRRTVELDPEERLEAGESSTIIEEALRTAIEALEPEDCLLVKLYYFDGLKLKEAGAILGVHEATASRRLAKIQTGIRENVEEILKTMHGWSPEEIAVTLSKAAVLVQSDVESMLSSERAQNRVG